MLGPTALRKDGLRQGRSPTRRDRPAAACRCVRCRACRHWPWEPEGGRPVVITTGRLEAPIPEAGARSLEVLLAITVVFFSPMSYVVAWPS